MPSSEESVSAEMSVCSPNTVLGSVSELTEVPFIPVTLLKRLSNNSAKGCFNGEVLPFGPWSLFKLEAARNGFCIKSSGEDITWDPIFILPDLNWSSISLPAGDQVHQGFSPPAFSGH